MGQKEVIYTEKIRKTIKEGKTGSPQELAEKIGLSRRMTYYYISRMKSSGEKIKYSRKKRSFFYEEQA